MVRPAIQARSHVDLLDSAFVQDGVLGLDDGDRDEGIRSARSLGRTVSDPGQASAVHVATSDQPYALFFHSLAARLRTEHDAMTDLVEVDAALALHARNLAVQLMLVGYFGQASTALIEKVTSMVESSITTNVGQEPWQVILERIFEREVPKFDRDDRQRLVDPEAAVDDILDLLEERAPVFPEELRAPSSDAIENAIQTMGEVRIVYGRTPGGGTVGPYGAMKRFCEAFGIDIPAFKRDVERARRPRRRRRADEP